MEKLEPRKRRENFGNVGESFPDPAGTVAGLIKSNETSFSSAHTKRLSSTVPRYRGVYIWNSVPPARIVINVSAAPSSRRNKAKSVE